MCCDIAEQESGGEIGPVPQGIALSGFNYTMANRRVLIKVGSVLEPDPRPGISGTPYQEKFLLPVPAALRYDD
jgi:hypothetical protein